MSTTDLSPIPRCASCGTQLEPGARYCSNCGQAVDVEPVSAPARTEPTYWSDTPPQSSVAAPSFTPSYPASGSGGGIGKLVSGSGRIGRLEYFLTIVGVWVVLLIAWAIIAAVDAPALTILLGLGTWLPAIVISVFAGVKRLHDFDQSGWLYLLFLVPFVSFIMLLVLIFKGSSPGLNKYGYADSGSVMG